MKLSHGSGHHASPECRWPHHTTYCAGGGVVITERCVQVRGVWHPIAELTDVGVARGASGPVALACLALGAAAAVVGEATRILDPTGHGSLIAGVFAVVVILLALGGLVGVLNRPQELWARCCGEWVLLFATRDKIEFGKVQRALQRAMVAHASLAPEPDPEWQRSGR